MNVLITGITGMIGSSFAAACRAQGWNTSGLARASAASRLQESNDAAVFRCDILDRAALLNVFQRVHPDLVAHFAAQAFNGASWDTCETTHVTNYLGTANVLNACREVVPGAKVLIACSSAQYGIVPASECPLKEDRLLRPVSPYGVSKVATECLGFQYHANFGMKVFLPRLFIHVGTGHPPATAIQNFARQLATIARRNTPPVVNVGAMDTARDFIDVRDGVDGMLLLLGKGSPGVPVNICTGTAVTIADAFDQLCEIAGVTVQMCPSAKLGRPSDEPLLVGDNSRLRALGWKQRFTFRETLEAVYRDWLERV